jgi:diaminohydroxyphosphoribosylaminopyrimidine deaminase/5-amino-6-(5-phosphoribosylamino)uracil reductase
MYVTLEPCCHQGKTPPCTDAILAAGIARVVAAMEDPDANVRGKGFAALRAGGVEVAVGVMERPARALVAAYVKLRTVARPWVICKWAQTLDGRIATWKRHSQWITGEPARRRAHELRALCDGVCVGVGTIWDDDPLLTNRSGTGRQPARVVLDGRLEISPSCRLLADTTSAPVIVATRHDASPIVGEELARKGAEVLRLPPGPGGVDLAALLNELGRRQWTYLLVEGGRAVHGSFLRQRLADELLVFVAPSLLGGWGSLGPVDFDDVDTVDQALRLPAPQVEPIGQDLLLRYVLTARED